MKVLQHGLVLWLLIMFPEWKMWNQFLQQTNGGLRLDAQEQSHPIEVEILHAHSVDEIFDAISYRKGSAIIRMLQGYLGDEIFQESLSLYMKSMLGKMQGQKIYGVSFQRKGYPVISVKFKDSILEFEQSQFSSLGFHGGPWIVPITLCLGSYDRSKTFLLQSKFENLDASGLFTSSDEKNEDDFGGASWIKVNVDPSGFYSVKYGDEVAARLRKPIENNCLSATDKYDMYHVTIVSCGSQ